MGFGAISYVHELSTQIQTMGLQDRVHFLEPVPPSELIDWTASADISMVLIENTCLSYYYAAPNKLYETLMAGVPYIASNFPEISRVHLTAQTGILVDPSDINQIVTAMTHLLSHPELLCSMSECTRLAAETEYNWEIEQKIYIEHLERIIEKANS